MHAARAVRVDEPRLKNSSKTGFHGFFGTDRYLIIYPFLLEWRFASVAGPRGATFGAGRFGGGARLLPFSRATSALSFAISAAAARGSDPHTTSLHRVANWKLETLSATFACAGELQTNIIVFAEPPTESDMSMVKGWFR